MTIRLVQTVLAALSLTVLAASLHVGPPLAAQSGARFAEAELFFELNDSDGDLGLHGSVDGDPWTELEIENLLRLSVDRELRQQGMTQLSFESAEPAFDELAPETFFRRFPEGRYRFSGLSADGRRIENTVTLSQVMAAVPANILLNRVRAAEDCESPLPTVIAPVLIDWDPVTRSHPEVGKAGPVTVSEYQLFVEGDGIALSLDLPPSITEFEVPAAFLARGGTEFKFEIIVRTAAGNNTAVESCFRLR
jgi:hypothetical protein